MKQGDVARTHLSHHSREVHSYRRITGQLSPREHSSALEAALSRSTRRRSCVAGRARRPDADVVEKVFCELRSCACVTAKQGDAYEYAYHQQAACRIPRHSNQTLASRVLLKCTAAVHGWKIRCKRDSNAPHHRGAFPKWMCRSGLDREGAHDVTYMSMLSLWTNGIARSLTHEGGLWRASVQQRATSNERRGKLRTIALEDVARARRSK